MKNMMMVGCLVTAMAMVSCYRPVDMVPPNTRPVVEPQPDKAMKSWNTTTRQEGDAVLGPLSTPRR